MSPFINVMFRIHIYNCWCCFFPFFSKCFHDFCVFISFVFYFGHSQQWINWIRNARECDTVQEMVLQRQEMCTQKREKYDIHVDTEIVLQNWESIESATNHNERRKKQNSQQTNAEQDLYTITRRTMNEIKRRKQQMDNFEYRIYELKKRPSQCGWF